MTVLSLVICLLLSLLYLLPVALADPKVVVHLVPHTHNDVGWLKTVDQYYVGSKKKYDPHAAVQYIFHTLIPELEKNPERKFIYVEQGFFQRWWRQQTNEMKGRVKKLVMNRQLEFINGGYCMHDEAATHYIDMIDQTTLGHRFIKEQFDQTPTIGWQVDPFGHSLTQASLLTYEVGFDGLFFGRIDYADSAQRYNRSEMEFIWRASLAAGDDNAVFAGALPTGGYNAPLGLCWDSTCRDPIWQDDPKLNDYNVPDRVDAFVAAAWEQGNHTNCGTNVCNIIWTMGEDFHYELAYEWFQNLDKAIHYVNKDGRVKALYSTPSQYLKAKHDEGLEWTTKVDDFFPYASAPFSYWTGYFSSRPALKRYVRTSSALLQIARQLEFFVSGNGSSTAALTEAQAVAQHHDAVAGTEKQHVAYDYAQRLGKGETEATAMMIDALASLSTDSGGMEPSLVTCPLLNISLCFTSELQSLTQPLLITLYNPLARNRTEMVTVPWFDGDSGSVSVSDGVNDNVEFSIVPVMQTRALTDESAQCQLVFYATVPALGYQSYIITQSQSQAKPMVADSDSDSEKSGSLSNGRWQIDVDTDAGIITQITDLLTKHTFPFTQQFYYYYAGSKGGQNTGAYVLQPNDTAPTPVAAARFNTTIVQTGINYALYQRSSDVDWVSQVVRLVGDAIEFEWTIGPLPNDNIGRELITRYTTDIDSQSSWYSDNNGREFSLRVRDYRPTWSLNVTNAPVSQNYVPVNLACGLNDTQSALWVLVDRAEGCTSMNDGQLEFLLHRRLFTDDRKGLYEPLNETQAITENDERIGEGLVVTGKHRITLTHGQRYQSDAAAIVRTLGSRIYSPLLFTAASLEQSAEDYVNTHVMNQSFIAESLPANVEVITLQPIDRDTVILRLAHQFGVNIDYHPHYSQSVTVDLETLFVEPIASIEEVSLTTNQRPVTKANRHYQWKIKPDQPSQGLVHRSASAVDAGSKYSFHAQQIRTFLVKVKRMSDTSTTASG